MGPTKATEGLPVRHDVDVHCAFLGFEQAARARVR